MVCRHTRTTNQRPGAVMVFALVTLVVLIGFASLTLDVGALYNTRADLQNAADAAALAGASMLAEDVMMEIRLAKQKTSSDISVDVFKRASLVAMQVTSFGGKPVELTGGDVITGWIDLNSSNSSIDTGKASSLTNAVHVITHRSKESPSGPVDLFFASIFGFGSAEVSASATAAFDDRVSGYDPKGDADLFPMTIGIDVYEKELLKYTDAYVFDPDTGEVLKESDGVPELNLYPLSTSPGNFGLLNIGNNNQSVGGTETQIENGVPPEKLEKEIGEPILRFIDEQGNSVTHTIGGSPGLKASLDVAIKSRIGDIVAVPVHDGYTGSGANTKYNIVGVRFVRIMAVSLKSGTKYMWIQPVSYTGSGVMTHPDASSTNGAAGRIILVR